MMRAAWFATLAVPCALLMVQANPSPASTTLDSTRLALLQSRVTSAGRVEVTLVDRVVEADRLILTSERLVFPGRRSEGALIGVGDPPLEPRGFAWDEVKRIDELHPSGGRGFVIGAVLGITLAGVVVMSRNDDSGEVAAYETVASVLGIPTLSLMGLLIGSMVAHRERIYP